jgi:hypothetical protein
LHGYDRTYPFDDHHPLSDRSFPSLADKRTGADRRRNASLVVRRVFGAAALFVSLGIPAHAASCLAPVGRAVTLKSTYLDPDVLVWDSRQRAIDYAAGAWSAREVIAHTLLAKPGTRATVIQCVTDAIRSRFADEAEDAVGVRIVNGPNRGHYGWVNGEDVHLAN